MKCSRCNSDVTEDGILTSTTPLATFPSFWSTSAQDATDGIKYVVKAMRCTKCGNIELNAKEKF